MAVSELLNLTASAGGVGGSQLLGRFENRQCDNILVKYHIFSKIVVKLPIIFLKHIGCFSLKSFILPMIGDVWLVSFFCKAFLLKWMMDVSFSGAKRS